MSRTVDLENISQGRNVQHSQWCYSMANINRYTSRTWAFFARSHRFPDIKYYTFPEIVWPWKYRSRSWCTTFAMTPYDGKYLTSYLMAIVMFALTICEILAKIIKYQKFWLWKWRSRSRSRRTELTPFDWKCSNPYRWFFLRILAILKHTFTQKVTHTQRDRVMTMGIICRAVFPKTIALKKPTRTDYFELWADVSNIGSLVY